MSKPEELVRATENLLPKKSKEVYDKEYDRFQCWMTESGVEIINESALLDYFEKLTDTFSPSSLWTKYSMLKKMVLINNNIDIGKYDKLMLNLKEGSKGYEAKKSKMLTREEVLKFVHEAPNKSFLMVKVALLFGIFGGCRRQDLVNMLVDHVEDRGSVIVVNVVEINSDKKRVFTIIEEKELNGLKLIREYAKLRPPNCSERRFFLNYKDGRCTAQPVGKNTFGKIPCTIATYLGLKDADKYSGHCLRRTSVAVFADPGASVKHNIGKYRMLLNRTCASEQVGSTELDWQLQNIAPEYFQNYLNIPDIDDPVSVDNSATLPSQSDSATSTDAVLVEDDTQDIQMEVTEVMQNEDVSFRSAASSAGPSTQPGVEEKTRKNAVLLSKYDEQVLRHEQELHVLRVKALKSKLINDEEVHFQTLRCLEEKHKLEMDILRLQFEHEKKKFQYNGSI